MNASKNTELLDLFHDTPLTYHGIVVCRPIDGRKFAGTAISPMYAIRRLTEAFGPCGIGWGLSINSMGFHQLDPDTVLHWAHVTLWYVHEGKRGEIEHVGCTLAAYRASNGPVRDEDAPKKSITDALTKAASLLGIGFDVHAGLRDTKYEKPGFAAEVAPDGDEFPDPAHYSSPELAINDIVRWIGKADRGALRLRWTQIQAYHARLVSMNRADLARQLNEAIDRAKERFGRGQR